MTTWRDIEWNLAVQEAIANLPPRQYRVVSLWLEGYNQREIAGKLKISQPAVCQLLGRAKLNIRNVIF